MKRIALVFFVYLLLLSLIGNTGTLEAMPAPPQIHAESAALIDVQSGRILYSKNGDRHMLIASLTKIMTAIVAIEAGNLSDRVKVSGRAFGVEGSSIYLKKGEEISLQNLIYGLMLRSGNDAATAIAEHVGGSLEGFVYMMNEKAAMLGMDHSHFANPHGLDAKGHYSTADDMAKLTAYALHNPVFQDIVKTKVKTVPDPGQEWNRTWTNKNKMLSLYKGADGMKTGYTKKARRCLVSSATRDGRQLAVVTLNDPDDWVDHQQLLDYGFSSFPVRRIVEKNAPISGTPFVTGNTFDYPLADSEVASLSKKTVIYPNDGISTRLGINGRLEIYLADEKVGSVPLLKREDQLAGRFSGSDKKNQSLTGIWLSVLKALFTFH